MKHAQKPGQEFLSPQNVATLLGFSRRFVYEQIPVWIAQFGLKVYKVGNGKKAHIRFRRSDIEALMNKMEIE